MNTHGHDDHNLQPEDAGVKAQPILMFLIILSVATIFVFVLIKGLLWSFEKMDAMNPATPATMVSAPESRNLPPEPRLQGAPMPNASNPNETINSDLPLIDLEKYRKTVDERITGYGWVNQEAKVAHIPIDVAKKMIAQKGLPMRPEASIAEVDKATETRKAVMNAGANAGRSIKK